MSSQVTVEKLSNTVWFVGAREVRPTKDIDSGPPPPWMEDVTAEYYFQFFQKIELFTNAITRIQKKYLEHAKTEHLISAQEKIVLAKLLMLLGWLTLDTEKSIPLLTSIRTAIDQFLGEEETPPDRLLLDSQLQLLDNWITSLLVYAQRDD